MKEEMTKETSLSQQESAPSSAAATAAMSYHHHQQHQQAYQQQQAPLPSQQQHFTFQQQPQPSTAAPNAQAAIQSPYQTPMHPYHQQALQQVAPPQQQLGGCVNACIGVFLEDALDLGLASPEHAAFVRRLADEAARRAAAPG